MVFPLKIFNQWSIGRLKYVRLS